MLGRARFGWYNHRPVPGAVWVHAVSLGETRAAQPLINALLKRGCRVLLTHTTATAWAEAQRVHGAAITAGTLIQQWLPYDFPGAMRRFFAAYQPRVGLLIEREVWPNLTAEAAKAGVPLVLVSARLSARSSRQMQRLHLLMRPAFARLQAVLAQTGDDAQRLLACGARSAQVVGNLKFDVEIPGELEQRGRAWAQRVRRPIICIASTRDGEETLFIRAVAELKKSQHRSYGANQNLNSIPHGNHPRGFERCKENWKDISEAEPIFMLIPRHVERFDEVAQLLAAQGARFIRRTEWEVATSVVHVDWILGDSTGEMATYYAASDIAIIGGSFLDFGGQNLVEACAAGLPVIVGPYTRNFAQAVEDAIQAGAAERVPDAATAVSRAMQWLCDAEEQGQRIRAAREFVDANRGATQRVMKALAAWL